MSEAPTIPVFRSPLADQHIEAGAQLGIYHGAEVPLSFGDPVLEHKAVRTSAGIFDFSFRSKFVLTGEHRVRFLHRIVSNNVQTLTSGQGTYATVLSAQGRILADLRIYLDEDRIWVDTDADLAEKAISTLRRYVIGDRVQIEPSDVVALAVQGAGAWRALERLHGSGLAPLRQEMDHRAVNCAGWPARLVRLSSTGEEGYELWVEPSAVAGLWKAARENRASLVPCGSEALEILRIEAGIPRYGPDLGEDTLPLEAGLLNALSFNKGCYIGQEIVERARSRGHVNWKLTGLRFDPAAAAPRAGDALTHQDRSVGEITSACYSPVLARPIALAYVRREVAEPGTRLLLGDRREAEVCALPFLKVNGAISFGAVANV